MNDTVKVRFPSLAATFVIQTAKRNRGSTKYTEAKQTHHRIEGTSPTDEWGINYTEKLAGAGGEHVRKGVSAEGEREMQDSSDSEGYCEQERVWGHRGGVGCLKEGSPHLLVR